MGFGRIGEHGEDHAVRLYRVLVATEGFERIAEIAQDFGTLGVQPGGLDQ